MTNSDQEKLNSLLKRLGDPGAAPLAAEETQWLEDFRRRYPFFTIPSATDGAEPALRDVVTAPSPEALARINGNGEAARFDNFYPDRNKPDTPTTSAAIDDFLNTYGHRSQEEDQLLERLIFNPVPDYAQQLAREEEASLPPEPALPADRHQLPEPSSMSPEARLNRFILLHRTDGHRNPPPSGGSQSAPPVPPVSEPRETRKPTPPDGLLSESLAKIYIKTRRYEQAYEILNGLSLRFPEKSSYFADQLRFLRKLILNERRRRIENQSNNNPNP